MQLSIESVLFFLYICLLFPHRSLSVCTKLLWQVNWWIYSYGFFSFFFHPPLKVNINLIFLFFDFLTKKQNLRFEIANPKYYFSITSFIFHSLMLVSDFQFLFSRFIRSTESIPLLIKKTGKHVKQNISFRFPFTAIFPIRGYWNSFISC